MTEAEQAQAIETMLAEITEHSTDASMPEEMRRAMEGFHQKFREEFADFRILALGHAALFLERVMKSGAEMEIAHRAVATALDHAAAVTVRSMYRKLGKPMHPARFAIVAYFNAIESEKLWEDSNAVGQQFVGEVKRALEETDQ